MGKGKNSSGLGRSLVNSKMNKLNENRTKQSTHVSDFIAGEDAHKKLKSIIERNDLDDYLATALSATNDFNVLRERQVVHANDSKLFQKSAHHLNSDNCGVSFAVDVPIPRRPILFVGPNKTKQKYSAAELDNIEKQAFLEWRKKVAKIEEEAGYILTPFEKNLEFWRQLWRVMEKADIVVQILDARNPLFFRCRDVERYTTEIDPKKRNVLVVNKSDFLTREQRREWFDFFAAQNVPVLFFSAIRELHYQGIFVPAETESTATRENNIGYGDLSREALLGDDTDILSADQLLSRLADLTGEDRELNYNDLNVCVGVIGFPNVGKSSLINALCGSKKVSISRQPGKTKHFQTILLDDITLCDCPGLVFPSVVATRAHLVINGVMPIDHYKGDIIVPAQLVCDRISIPLMKNYAITPKLTSWKIMPKALQNHSQQLIFPSPATAATPATVKVEDLEDGVLDARAFVTELSVKRHYISQGVGGQVDLFKTTKMILKDFCSGKLLHCESPPKSN